MALQQEQYTFYEMEVIMKRHADWPYRVDWLYIPLNRTQYIESHLVRR